MNPWNDHRSRPYRLLGQSPRVTYLSLDPEKSFSDSIRVCLVSEVSLFLLSLDPPPPPSQRRLGPCHSESTSLYPTDRRTRTCSTNWRNPEVKNRLVTPTTKECPNDIPQSLLSTPLCRLSWTVELDRVTSASCLTRKRGLPHHRTVQTRIDRFGGRSIDR